MSVLRPGCAGRGESPGSDDDLSPGWRWAWS